MEKASEILASKLGGVLFGENLKNYTKLSVGGQARYLYVAQNIEDLVTAVLLAQENNILYRVIGEGSQTIFSDNEYDGLIIINKSNRIIDIGENNQIMCDSGVKLDSIASYAAERGLSGLEFLSGQDGTVGAAVYNNNEIENRSINNSLRTVTLLSSTGKISIKPAVWLESDNINRLRINQSQPWTVLVATFQLQPRRFNDIKNDISSYRSKIPKINGHFIRNVFKASNKDINKYLQKCGVCRMKEGGIQIPKNCMNCLYNFANGNATEARRLCENIIEKVNKEQKIEIYENIDFLGRWQ